MSEEPIYQTLNHLPVWTCPIVLELKKIEANIFCINFRKSKAVMKSNELSVLRVEESLDDLRGAIIFITLDFFNLSANKGG